MQLNPARGRKPSRSVSASCPLSARFMQLNPARGRKLERLRQLRSRSAYGLCSSTPRGDGNNDLPVPGYPVYISMVYAAQPREGTETSFPPLTRSGHNDPGLCSSTPRGDGNHPQMVELMTKIRDGLCSSTPRGDGNQTAELVGRSSAISGLCSSTPRGDGNMKLTTTEARLVASMVYAAQPREGTETPLSPLPISLAHTYRFMQLNPARGRKLT